MAETTRARNVVRALIEQLPNNPAMGACLRRADNPDTEYMAWEYLARFGVALDDARARRAFVLVGAALAREKPDKDGERSIAQCLGETEETTDGSKTGPASARFRRLLACDSQEEACRVLRPMIRLVTSRSRTQGRLSYERLLQDMLYFGPRVKERWAQEFYAQPPKKEASEG